MLVYLNISNRNCTDITVKHLLLKPFLKGWYQFVFSLSGENDIFGWSFKLTLSKMLKYLLLCVCLDRHSKKIQVGNLIFLFLRMFLSLFAMGNIGLFYLQVILLSFTTIRSLCFVHFFSLLCLGWILELTDLKYLNFTFMLHSGKFSSSISIY